MSADNRARYVVSLIRNDDATTRSGANKMPCCSRLQYYGLAQNRQLVLVCADCWCEIVGSDGAINIRWGGRVGVSQVIRSEGQNDTGLSLVRSIRAQGTESWKRLILFCPYVDLCTSGSSYTLREGRGDADGPEFLLRDEPSEDPTRLIDGTVWGLDNAKHCGPANAFLAGC